MAIMVAIRMAEGCDMDPVDGGVDISGPAGPLVAVFRVEGSPPCTGCEAVPHRTYTFDDSGAVVNDAVITAHPTTCQIAYCPHGFLRASPDCAICLANPNGGE